MLFSANLLPVWLTLPFVIFKTSVFITGLPGLGQIWRCGVVSVVTGHLTSCLRGVKEWGGAPGSHKLLCSVAPPPARLLRIGGVCALRAAFLTLQLCPTVLKYTPTELFMHTMHWLTMKFVPSWLSLLISTAEKYVKLCALMKSMKISCVSSVVRQTAHNLLHHLRQMLG